MSFGGGGGGGNNLIPHKHTNTVNDGSPLDNTTLLNSATLNTWIMAVG